MLNNDLSISVVIPVYNGEDYIEEAIKSALNQSLKPSEIIIIDDGSRDKTAKIASNYSNSLSYYYKENGGEASARNLGIKIAQFPLIAFLDADDIWLPNSLELLQESFLLNHQTKLSIGFSQEILLKEREWKAEMKPYIGLQLSAALIHYSTFELIGLFDENLQLAVDTDWLFRVRENNLVTQFINQTVVYYRRHDKNISLQKDLLDKNLLKACRASLIRRRTKGLNLLLPSYGFRRTNL